ncbi:MAG: DUF2235 domain-containing protein [Pseudomonadota bacterium]
MSAILCPVIDESFANAEAVDTFYDKIALDRIRKTYEVREQPILGSPGESCKTNLFFGFFFDGTKNNYIQAETGKNHSNVARLYDCYPGISVKGTLPDTFDWKYQPERYSHFFKAYIPGVASPFPQINDLGTGVMGAAGGHLGEARIVWGLIQAINNVHRYFHKGVPMILTEEANLLIRRIRLTKESRKAMVSRTKRQDSDHSDSMNWQFAREIFEIILLRLHKAIEKNLLDKNGVPKNKDPAVVKKIFVSVFGFSRGATQARAFTNWLLSLCKLDAILLGKSEGMTLGGFPVKFDFLGLFDTVASVGLGNSLGNSVAGKMFDGHGAWSDTEDSLRIPPDIRCIHLVAAHELRRSFPVDSISVKSVMPDNSLEVVVPGVHSDLGCGYAPLEQGRGARADGSDMLARIPLVYMYKMARLAGVPLKLELASAEAKKRFVIQPSTIKALNDYLAACKKTKGSVTEVMREQARLQMEWRLARRASGKTPLQSSPSFLRANNFDKNDLDSASREFEVEIAKFEVWLADKGKKFVPSAQERGFDNSHLDEWEEIATWWDKRSIPGPAVMTMFDDYVHDSRAWFKLIPGNPDNPEGAKAKLDEWTATRENEIARAKMRAKNRRDVERFSGQRTRDDRQPADESALSSDQLKAIAEYKRTGQIPRYQTIGREPYEACGETWWLAARAGYLRYRKIYGGWDSELLSQATPVENENPLFASSVSSNEGYKAG